MLLTGVPDDPAARTRTDRGALGDCRLFSPTACAASLKIMEPVQNSVAQFIRVYGWGKLVYIYTRVAQCMALSHNGLFEVKSENYVSENQWRARLNFPVFGHLRQSHGDSTSKP